MGLLGAIAKRSVDDWVKLGYPESVAKRIVSGELPMDEASRAARRDAFGEKMYRGLREEYQVDGGKKVSTWASENPQMANDYAMFDVTSENSPNVIPVRMKARTPLKVSEPYARSFQQPEDVADTIQLALLDRYQGGDISKQQLIDWEDAAYDWVEKLPEWQQQTTRPVYEYWNKDQDFIDMLNGLGFDSIDSPEYTDAAFGWGGKPDARNLGVFDGAQIRSEYAAFDPEYTGSNILGMRPEALSGLMAAIGSSEQPENIYGADQVTPPTQRQIVNQQMNALGIDPVEQAGYEYGSLIPARKNKETGEIEPAVPAVGRDIIRGLLDLMEGTQSGYFDPRSAIDVMM